MINLIARAALREVESMALWKFYIMFTGDNEVLWHYGLALLRNFTTLSQGLFANVHGDFASSDDKH